MKNLVILIILAVITGVPAAAAADVATGVAAGVATDVAAGEPAGADSNLQAGSPAQDPCLQHSGAPANELPEQAGLLEQAGQVLSTGLENAFSTNAAPPANQTFNIYWENDGTFIRPNHRTDRHYTDGVKTLFTQQPNTKWLRDFGRWNDFGKNDANTHTALGYFFGQSIYTPDHVDKPLRRVREDRVFAGWLYGGAFVQRATEKQMEHFELSLGVIGPSSMAEETQNYVHEILDIAKPKGWDDQLHDELAANFAWFKRQQIEGLFLKRTPDFDTQLEYGFTAGSVYRNANIGIIGRLGKDLPNDFGPGRLDAPACAAGVIPKKQTYFYIFGRAGVKYVQFDRFLTGLDTEPVVGQYQGGLVWRYNSFQISYSQTFFTRDYREQPSADAYATVNLTWYF
jgi:hypothetical protein